MTTYRRLRTSYVTIISETGGVSGLAQGTSRMSRGLHYSPAMCTLHREQPFFNQQTQAKASSLPFTRSESIRRSCGSVVTTAASPTDLAQKVRHSACSIVSTLFLDTSLPLVGFRPELASVARSLRSLPPRLAPCGGLAEKKKESGVQPVVTFFTYFALGCPARLSLPCLGTRTGCLTAGPAVFCLTKEACGLR